ncbi:MAG TPA: cytochrome B6 [Planctomicrobium sp.]|nr:cytochrome B6 [Planctomicrobium sp.]
MKCRRVSKLLVVGTIPLIGVIALWAADAVGQRPPPQTYMPVVPTKPFAEVMQADVAEKQQVQQAMQALLASRYDLANRPSEIQMSAGRRAVQSGIRVRLPQGVTWDSLGQMTPAEIKERNLFPQGFRSLPHVKHPTGGMVFPEDQIKTIQEQEFRDIKRFDVEYDLPDHFRPEFPPPMFLTTHPELGDVTKGQVVTIRNYYELFSGVLTPVQMEGLRLLLTPIPQQQFNQTEDRKSLKAELGVTCFDCHTNGHTNATFHLNPDTRPQDDRMRLDTVSLRGVYNQQIHGSKRSLRTLEDFTEFEQRTAYFDGDHVTAAKKGVFLPDRASQVAMMAQMQTMLDFPPAPKLDRVGRLKPDVATESELRGEQLFLGKAQCSICHAPPFFLDDKMHDLKLERFYDAEVILGQHNKAPGAIKTFTLRGIKDSPPYMHDGRLLTLDDTVEFFNLVLELKLNEQEKKDLVAYMLCL